ncbi:hypothetical protein [Pectinatus sottacetonis]|uniref:hypothetical protein n=1 Tax=Pectinatus sottacetonis TaxID=1002795 RepID=UPI0018C48C1C|nr:hypothetical protein [Pectinatus sottacetonis]
MLKFTRKKMAVFMVSAFMALSVSGTAVVSAHPYDADAPAIHHNDQAPHPPVHHNEHHRHHHWVDGHWSHGHWIEGHWERNHR